MKDDVKAGVKSTALSFGASRVKPYLAFFGVCFLGSLILVGVMNQLSYVYFLAGVLGGAAHLVWQLSSLNVGQPESCWTVVRQLHFQHNPN